MANRRLDPEWLVAIKIIGGISVFLLAIAFASLVALPIRLIFGPAALDSTAAIVLLTVAFLLGCNIASKVVASVTLRIIDRLEG